MKLQNSGNDQESEKWMEFIEWKFAPINLGHKSQFGYRTPTFQSFAACITSFRQSITEIVDTQLVSETHSSL